jgi:molybdate transport system substrate-binding protein
MRAVIAAVCGLVLFSTGALSEEVSVLASGAIREIVTELLPSIASSGDELKITWAGTAQIKEKLASGEAYDLVIVGAPEVDAFIQAGKIKSGTRVDLVRSGVGVAVKKGAPRPDIGSVAALKQTLLNAKSVAYSTGPSGEYVLKMLDKLGIAAEMKPKLVRTASGTRVGDYLDRGEAEIGFQQIAELIHEAGSDYIGPLPAELQNITVYSSGIHSEARHLAGAKRLQMFIASPEAASVIKRNGMEPAS